MKAQPHNKKSLTAHLEAFSQNASPIRPPCKWGKKRRIGLALLSAFLLELLLLGSIALIAQEFIQ